MTDTDRISKAMMPPGMEQRKPEEKKPEEKVDEQKDQTLPKVDPVPQNDNDDDDMSLVDEAMGAGLKVNTGGKGGQLISQDELNERYAEMAAEIGEKAQEKRDAVPKAVESAEKKEHYDEISRLENEYRTSTKEDTTAARERVGVKEVLEVPNYREHVTDDQMQGWGRALARFGSVGLKEGANAIDAATKALGEFGKLTRAFLSPNPMSAPGQLLASTMVGMNTMYDTIDEAGELIGIKQGADKSIVMETDKGRQYFKDKDRAEQAAKFMMQSFNDQIKDTLGPDGDVTQLNPAQFKRIYEKMEAAWAPEIERIKGLSRAKVPLSLEDRAIWAGWDNISNQYVKNMKEGGATANEYAKEVGVHEKAINDLDKQYGKDVKAYDSAIAAIDKDERAQQRSLGADYKNDSKSIRGGSKTVDAWKTGFDNAVRNKDSIGALIRMTLGPEANRRLKDGNALLKTIEGAQNQANSNATNPNFTPEQQDKWLKIANVFGKRIQTIRNMSAEQRKQYALRLSGVANVVEGAPKAGGRTSNVDDDPLGFLGATKTQRKAIVKLTPKQYSDKKIAEWKENHVLETDQSTSVKHRNLYKGAMDIVGKMAEEEREAYLNPDMSPEERADTLKRMVGYWNRLTDLEGVLWGRNGLEANDVFDESYRKVYNGMGREDYLKTLPKREREFSKAKGRSKSAREYNVLMEDYESRKDDLDMLRYDFLNGKFKDWRSRRNAILRGRHLNRLLDDQRDRLSTMYDVLNRAGKKGLLPGHSFERPEPSGEMEQQVKDTKQKNNENETIDADVQGGPSVNGTETEEEFDTISEDLKTIDKEGLEKRIADLKMAQERLGAEQSENRKEPVVGTETSESDNMKVPEKRIEPSTRPGYETTLGKQYSDDFEEILNQDIPESKKRDSIGKLLLKVNNVVEITKDESVKKEFERLQKEMNYMWKVFNKIDSSTFDREQQEKNADNLRAAEENGLNPEHGETFVANTGIDESKIRTPSEDPRKVDSRNLFNELPDGKSGLKIASESIPVILRGIWPKGIETIDGKVYGTGKGNNLKRTLLGAKNALEMEVQKFSRYNKKPTQDTINNLAKMRDDLIEAWDWVNNNMKNPSNYGELRRNTFEVAGNPIDDATRLINGSWTPWVKKSDMSFEELLKAKLDERYGHFTG